MPHPTRKLGRRPKRHDPRTLKLSRYLNPNLPSPPAYVDWTGGVGACGMMLNDQLGDCTCAAIGHAVQTLSKMAGAKEITVSDDDVLAAYRAVSGYDGTPDTDNGAVMLDVLKYWKNTGVGGHRIAAFVAVDHTNINQCLLAAWLFGGLYTGWNLPESAMSQVDAGQPWDVVAGSPVDGGHCVWIPQVKTNGFQFVCKTWGQDEPITEAFANAFADEFFAVISPDWIAPSGLAPSDLNMEQLLADARAI